MGRLVGWLALSLALTGCTPSTLTPTPGQQSAEPSTPTSVTIAIAGEVDTLGAKVGGGDTYNAEFDFMSSSPLVVLNGANVPQPLLAADLPSRDTGSWVVNADGTMATTWHIRPNAKWHDGRAVTPEDYIFTAHVYQDPNLPVTPREPERFMDRVERADDTTFVIYWNQSYPWASQLITRALDPLLPNHIMGPIYESSPPKAFLGNDIWQRTSWVGTGPYLVADRVAGSQITYRAWDEYFMGRPKIDRVIFNIIGDANTVVANLLSGAADVTVGPTLGQIAGSNLKDQWGQSGEGQVIITPVRFRYMEFQQNASTNGQPALLDPRGRQAVAFGMDRQNLAAVTTAGTSPPADIYLPPNDRAYQAAIQTATTYPFDPDRALRLLGDLGWSRGSDGMLRNGRGEPFDLEVRTTTGADNLTEATIVADGLSRLGMQPTQNSLSELAQRDQQYRVSFPGVNLTARSIRVPATLGIWSTASCPNPRQNYVGDNRGCWQNGEFDRLFQVASTTLDEGERGSAIASALKILTEDVGILGISYNSENVAVRRGLVGPGSRSSEQVGVTWNIYEWRWTS